MEVFVMIVLLVGAISQGSAAHDGVEGEPAMVEVPAAVRESNDEPGEVRATAEVDQAQLQDCMLDRHYMIYRDLSRSHVRKSNTATESAGDCEGVCADE